MLTSITNIHDEFTALFRPSITIGATVIPTLYANESRNDLTERTNESYPQIRIYDYTPEFDSAWNQNYYKRVDGFRDTDNDGKIDRGYLYSEPIRLMMKYDVTTYTKNPNDRWLIQQYFLSRFTKNGAFIFNKSVLNSNQYDDVVGDVTPYIMTPAEVKRSDGVREVNYEFVIKPMVAIQEPEDVVLLQTLELNAQNIPYSIIAVQYQNGIYIPVVVTQTIDYYEANIVNSTTFVATHNFNKPVIVSVRDTNGTEVIPEVIHVSINSVTVTFSSPFTGKIICK